MGHHNSQLDAIGQVTVVGTGLLGGSIGLGLKKAGFAGRIVGVGRRQSTVRRAGERGCIDAGYTTLVEAVAEARESAQGTVHLLVLATPLSTFDAIFDELNRMDLAGTIITDVGSTKQQVCQSAAQRLGEPHRFVGSHPMAGSEQHGPDYARADLFVGCPCILTPEAHTSREAQDTVEAVWRALGMRLVHMTPQEHDRQVALISHLPHAVASLLVSLAQRGESLRIASSGFRDTTRVASGDPRVWADIFSANRRAVSEAIDALYRELGDFKQQLEHNDHAGMLEALSRNKAARDQWLAAADGHDDESGE